MIKTIIELDRIPISFENWMTNEMAEEYYVCCGYSLRIMSFEAWCKKENITIIGSEEV